jgi:hypothetical protein
MFRNALIIFLLGWTIWFMVDKPPPAFRGLPEINDSIIENFQIAFNILKAGHLNVSFVYIWNAHYIILSLLGGALLSIAIELVSNLLSRRRMRQLIFPKSVAKPDADCEKNTNPLKGN